MKLPSVQYLFAQASKALIRFPLTILSALIGVSVSVYAFEMRNEITNVVPYVNVILAAALGIPVYFCAKILIENRTYNLLGKLLTFILPSICLLLIYLSFPDSEQSNNSSVPYIRYVVYNLIAHLFVSFIPYWRKGNLNAFWNYNKLLFLRLLTSLLYSVFLYGGLALALVSLDLLFDVDLHDELFMHLFIVIFGFFNTWFFVAGIPTDFKELDGDTNYPKGLKIFTQYVLLPILGLYLVILYSYGTKIIVEWQLPKGIVSYLISGVSTLGIFSFLLIYPYGKLKDSLWIKKFTLGYYYLLIPLIALLFVAIVIRLQDYGFTIKRYIVLLLGIWLTINAIYFIIKRKNIKFIPISLTIILGLMSFGPWGMFSLSEKSQSDRLVSILEDNGIIKEGKIQNEVIWNQDSLPEFHSYLKSKNDSLLSDSLINEVYSIIHYMAEYHTFEMLDSYFEQNLSKMMQQARDSSEWVYEEEVIMESMGLTHIYNWSNDADGNFENRTIESKKSDVKDVRGYDYLKYFNKRYRSGLQSNLHYTVEGDRLTIGFRDHKQEELFVSYQNDTLDYDIRALQENLTKKYGKRPNLEVPVDEMTIIKETNKIKIKMEINRVGVRENKDSLKFNFVNGDMYLKIK